MDMEEETRRELASLQREKELLQSKEKENEDAIDEARGVMSLKALLCLLLWTDRSNGLQWTPPHEP